MTLQNLYDDVYNKTGLTTNDLGTSELLTYLNQKKDEVFEAIVEVNEDFLLTSSYLDMTANTQDVALPTGSVKLKRLERTDDGTNWYLSVPLDINEIGHATDSTTINNNFTTTEPYHDVKGGVLSLLPVPTATITNGLRAWYVPTPADMSAVTDTLTLPSDFNPLVSIGAISIVAGKYQLPILQQYAALYESGLQRMKKQLGRRVLDSDVRFQSNYENYG